MERITSVKERVSLNHIILKTVKYWTISSHFNEISCGKFCCLFIYLKEQLIKSLGFYCMFITYMKYAYPFSWFYFTFQSMYCTVGWSFLYVMLKRTPGTQTNSEPPSPPPAQPCGLEPAPLREHDGSGHGRPAVLRAG